MAMTGELVTGWRIKNPWSELYHAAKRHCKICENSVGHCFTINWDFKAGDRLLFREFSWTLTVIIQMWNKVNRQFRLYKRLFEITPNGWFYEKIWLYDLKKYDVTSEQCYVSVTYISINSIYIFTNILKTWNALKFVKGHSPRPTKFHHCAIKFRTVLDNSIRVFRCEPYSSDLTILYRLRL